MLFFVFAALTLRHSFHILASPAPESLNVSSNSTISPLEVFEVQAPLRASYEGASCQQVVVQYNFAASYGTPYVGEKHEDFLAVFRHLKMLTR